ncbi:MAG: lactonase family protein [Bulleidia sp.]
MKTVMHVGSVGKKNRGSISGEGEGVSTIVIEDGVIRTSCIPANQVTMLGKNHEKGVLYGVSESRDFTGLNGSGGGVLAYRIREDGSLDLLNESISYGSRPCYITLCDDGRHLLVANHGSHTTVTCSYVVNEHGEYELKRGFDDSGVAVFEVLEDGRIGKLCDLKIFDGSGYWCHGGGQSTAHVHCVKERDGLVIACNRGCDEIIVMKLNSETGKLTVLNRNHVHPGDAPRHVVFHPGKQLISVINENYPCICTYQIHNDGTLTCIQKTGTMMDAFYVEHPLPVHDCIHADAHEKNDCAMMRQDLPMGSDIHISNDGRHLYVSSRLFSGNGSITVYDIQDDGMAVLKQVKQLPGSDPRGFALHDNTLYVGLLEQNVIVGYAVDQEGMIGEVIHEIPVKAPSCIVF